MCSTAAHCEPSTLVHLVPAQQGTRPALVEAYGSAIPAGEIGTTVSLRQDGFVASLAVTPGEAVRQGQTLLQFEASATASAAYGQALNALSVAQGQRAHVARLLAQRLATSDQLQAADAAAADARMALETLKHEGAGRARLAVAAPFDGIVATIPVAQGDRVAPGAALLTLNRADELVVTVGIEPADFARVQPGQAVTLTPVAGGPALAGHVLRLDGGLNPRTRLIDVDVGTDGRLLAGGFYRAAITTGQLSGWIVPHDAVLADEHGAYLFQANGDHAARVGVSVLASEGTEDIVQGGLDASRKVVVEGAAQLDDGAALRTSDQPAK